MRYPSWVDCRGYPLSWAHFVVGLRRMADESARDELRVARAFRLGQTPSEKEWKQGTSDLQRAAGLK